MQRIIFIICGFVLFSTASIAYGSCKDAITAKDVSRIHRGSKNIHSAVQKARFLLALTELEKAEALEKLTTEQLLRLALVFSAEKRYDAHLALYGEKAMSKLKPEYYYYDNHRDLLVPIFEELASLTRQFDRKSVLKALLKIEENELVSELIDAVAGYRTSATNEEIRKLILEDSTKAVRYRQFGEETVKIRNDLGWNEALLYLKKLDLKPGQRLVGLGSGFGRMGVLIEILFPGVEFIGYEIANERVREAARAQFVRITPERPFQRVQDLANPEFKPALADAYFIDGPFTDFTAKKVLSDLETLAKEKDFLVMIRGNSNKDASPGFSVPWLSELEKERPKPEPKVRVFKTINFSN